MATNPLHPTLLRPPILHILRAAGFTSTRPSVLETLTDLASRYLTLLATHTARHALLRAPSSPFTSDANEISIIDVRMALQDVGALFPQISEMEEQARGEEDLRGVEVFVGWCMGEGCKEIRRIAGLLPDTATTGGAAAATAINVEGEGLEGTREDYLTALKKKHSKTGEESRYQGTVLGKDMGEREISIEGGEVESIGAWGERLRERWKPRGGSEEKGEGGAEVVEMGSDSSSPLSEISREAN